MGLPISFFNLDLKDQSPNKKLLGPAKRLGNSSTKPSGSSLSMEYNTMRRISLL
jgi:hypothetical protein